MTAELLKHPKILSVEPFVPEPWESIIADRVFPAGVNAPWYQGQIKFLEALRAENLDAYSITYQGQVGKVTGIAVLPKGTTADSKLPLVLFNRGGNREYGRLTVINIVFPIADLVKAGYAVLASNYRGNHGGEGHDEFGGGDVNDVLDLLAIGKEMPWWDGARAYMLGWSRGGMMTYVALKRGAQVNAAATLAGISSLEQSREERPEMQRLYETLIPGGKDHPHALQVALEARSAVCWPDAISAPLLMLHGDADKSVSHHHSELLDAALTRVGAEHRFVRYAAGTHSLSRYHREIAGELLAWFANHR